MAMLQEEHLISDINAVSIQDWYPLQQITLKMK
jgi:hypothetical protein